MSCDECNEACLSCHGETKGLVERAEKWKRLALAAEARAEKAEVRVDELETTLRLIEVVGDNEAHEARIAARHALYGGPTASVRVPPGPRPGTETLFEHAERCTGCSWEWCAVAREQPRLAVQKKLAEQRASDAALCADKDQGWPDTPPCQRPRGHVGAHQSDENGAYYSWPGPRPNEAPTSIDWGGTEIWNLVIGMRHAHSADAAIDELRAWFGGLASAPTGSEAK